MKVILLSGVVFPFHHYGGMQKYVYYLGKYLVRQGLDVEIVTSWRKGLKSQVYDGINYTFICPPIWHGLGYQGFSLNAARYLRKRDFDILHSFLGVACYYLRLGGRAPVVVQAFGNEAFKLDNPILNLISQPMQWAISYSMKHADSIASSGEVNAREITNLFKVPPQKLFYLLDGVDLGLVEGYLSNVKITRAKIGIDDADLVLINVNRLDRNKGVPYLIDAMKILSQELDVRLILVGTGSQEQKIKGQIRELGLENKVVHFKNISEEEVFQLYTLADISVTPTLFEGLPLVILEAMACGKPVVASNVSEVPQVVKPGQNGFLVPPKNPEAIAAAVLEIHRNDLKAEFGQRSKEIVKGYDWSIIARKAITKYENLIKRR